MEFVAYGETIQLLLEQGIREVTSPDGRVTLELVEDKDTVHMHVACAECVAEPFERADVHQCTRENLPDAVDEVIHRMKLSQLLLMPVAKWRKVFDAVAFSMADNEDWQEVDATATVELNTRDPLLCEPGDFHTVLALVKAFFSDAEAAEQGLLLTSTITPMVVELVPAGAVRITLGSVVLADELAEAFKF